MCERFWVNGGAGAYTSKFIGPEVAGWLATLSVYLMVREFLVYKESALSTSIFACSLAVQWIYNNHLCRFENSTQTGSGLTPACIIDIQKGCSFLAFFLLNEKVNELYRIPRVLGQGYSFKRDYDLH